MNCKSCELELTSKYCPNCGHPSELDRIDGHYIVREIQKVLNFERGFFYTVRALITNPGQNVRIFLTENRNRLVKPIIFIIVTSLIYSFCNSIFKFEEGYTGYLEAEESTTVILFKWVQGNYGYSNIMMGVSVALWVSIFFRKYKFNIFEILILLCFVMGAGMLILSVFGIIDALTPLKAFRFGVILAFLYTSWAIGQFYDKRKIFTYVKAFLAYILGTATFYLALMIAGGMIDYFIKH